ncbi:hypothetical protein JA1_002233 [Spathaspora sp. JA1]|nr:hypothetical protein JA1_002233 [Spathaspora sp. JA1]
MMANSTNISNRIFRSQRYVVLLILSSFIVLLVITGLAGHHEKVVQHVKNFKTKASDSLAEFYNSNHAFTSDKSEYQMEKEAEAEEEEAEKNAEAAALLESEKLADEKGSKKPDVVKPVK